MKEYLWRRLAATLVALVGVSLLVFGAMRLVPGTVVEQLLGQSALVGEETLQALRRFFGLDRAWYVQYLEFLGGALRGDLGESWRSFRPVSHLIAERLPLSVELGMMAIAVSLAIGVPAGMVAASRRHSWVDNAVQAFSTLGLSVPAFWQGTLLILLFSKELGWLPSLEWVPFTVDPWENLKMLALPALTLGTASAAMITRMTRSALLDVIHSEYVRTARAKGVHERRVLWRHALRNALIPVVTVAGVQLGYIMAGIVVIEEVFSLPGLGRMLLNAIIQRDYPVVQGTVLFIATMSMLLNLLVDVLYAVIDPRIRYD